MCTKDANFRKVMPPFQLSFPRVTKKYRICSRIEENNSNLSKDDSPSYKMEMVFSSTSSVKAGP